MDKDGTPLLIKKEKVYRKAHHRSHHHQKYRPHQNKHVEKTISPVSSLASSPTSSPKRDPHGIFVENNNFSTISPNQNRKSATPSSSSSSTASSTSDGTGSSSTLSESDKDSCDDGGNNPDPVFYEQRMPKKTESGINRGKATISDVVQGALSRIDGLLSVTSMLPKTEPVPPRYTIDFDGIDKTNAFLHGQYRQGAAGSEIPPATSLVWHPT